MKRQISKVSRITLMVGSAGLLLGGTSLHAQDVGLRGFYVSTDAGVNLVNNLTIDAGSVSLNPGLRWDASVGYAIKLTDQLSLAPELEVGILYNSLNSASADGASASVSGNFTQVPVLANAILNYEFSPNWVVYGGGAAGYDYCSLNVSTVGANEVDATGSESDFAWQGLAGIRYKFGSGEIGLGYKYLAVTPSGLHTVGSNAILASYTFLF
jgi:opacity protein-like surface antigen